MIPTNITYQQKLNQLRLDTEHPKNQGINFVLVEGDTDIRLFRKLFDLDKCKVEYIPGGKLKVEECVVILLEEYTQIIGVIDADFSHLEETSEDKINIFLTDYHDIEMMTLIEDDILHKVLHEYTNIPKNEHITFRDKVLNSIKKISYLKWLNDRESLELNFKKTNILPLISFNNFSLDFDTYLSRLLTKSENARIKDSTIISQKTDELSQKNVDLFQLTNGHDALNLFAKYIREKSKRKLAEDSIPSALRMLYTNVHFRQTNLHKALSEWANENNTQLFTT